VVPRRSGAASRSDGWRRLTFPRAPSWGRTGECGRDPELHDVAGADLEIRLRSDDENFALDVDLDEVLISRHLDDFHSPLKLAARDVMDGPA
jgi:hypothetical protein